MIIEVNYLFKEELWLFNVVIVIYNTVYDKLRNKMEYKNEQCAKPLIRINNRGLHHLNHLFYNIFGSFGNFNYC